MRHTYSKSKILKFIFLYKHKNFFQNLKILQVHFCVQRLSQHFLAVVWVWQKVGRNPFFAIIRAKMDEIQKFLRELFRINDDIYDAKY